MPTGCLWPGTDGSHCMLAWHEAVCTRGDQGRAPGREGAHTESGEMPIVMKRETSPAGSEMGDQRAVGPMTRGGPFPAVSSQNPNLFPGQIRTLSYFLNSQGSGGSTSKGDHGVKTQR